MAVLLFFFFFSSRRRHTRFDCDWSSDVCSSDLDSLLLEVLENLDAIEDRHLDVQQDGVVIGLRGLVDAFLSRPRLVDPVTLVFERHPNRFTDPGLVIDY